MAKRTRIMSMIIAILMLVAMLSSAEYIVAEADHDCTGEHCTVCQQIAACENTLKQLSLAVVVFAITAGLAYPFCPFVTPAINADEPITLITLKVKLSN